AGELADPLHLLRLAQGLLDPLPLLDLAAQVRIGRRQFLRAFRDPGFQRPCHLAERPDETLALLLRLFAVRYVEYRADMPAEASGVVEARDGRHDAPAPGPVGAA